MKSPATLKDWSVIKGKIFTPKQNFYGLVVIFFDNVKNTVENLSLVFSIYSETHDLQLDDKWDKFEKKIQDMIYSGNFSQGVSMTTADKLKDDTQFSTFGSELRADIDKNSIDLVSNLFKQTLAKILNDNMVEVQCQFELISSEELVQGRIREESQKSDVTDDSIKTSAETRLVNAKLILSPVGGKLITELKEGDTILVNLVSAGMTENMLIDKLKLRKPDGTAKSVPAKITKMQPLTKGVQMLVHITEKYYAKITEEEKILVKMFAPITDIKTASAKISGSASSVKKEGSGFSWMTVALVVFLGILLAYFVFIRG